MLHLHAAALGRTAAVVRNRGDVADRPHLDTGGSQRTHSRLTARTRTADPHIDRAQTMVARLIGGVDGRLLRGKRGALTRPAKAERPELFQEIVSPLPSVMVTMVLLNDA